MSPLTFMEGCMHGPFSARGQSATRVVGHQGGAGASVVQQQGRPGRWVRQAISYSFTVAMMS